MHKVDSRCIVFTCSDYTEYASIGPLVRSNIRSIVGRECNSGANNNPEINEVTGMHGIGRPLANIAPYTAPDSDRERTEAHTRFLAPLQADASWTLIRSVGSELESLR